MRLFIYFWILSISMLVASAPAQHWVEVKATPSFILSGRVQWHIANAAGHNIDYCDDLDTFNMFSPTIWLTGLRASEPLRDIEFDLRTSTDTFNRPINKTTLFLDTSSLRENRSYSFRIVSKTISVEVHARVGQQYGIIGRISDSVYPYANSYAFEMSLGIYNSKPSWVLRVDETAFPKHYAYAVMLMVTAMNRYTDPQRNQDQCNPFYYVKNTAF